MDTTYSRGKRPFTPTNGGLKRNLRKSSPRNKQPFGECDRIIGSNIQLFARIRWMHSTQVYYYPNDMGELLVGTSLHLYTVK